MAPELDVFPFHIISPHIQPDELLQGFMLPGRKGKFTIAFQQSANNRILAFQFLPLGLRLGIFRADSRQIHHDVAVDFRKLLENARLPFLLCFDFLLGFGGLSLFLDIPCRVHIRGFLVLPPRKDPLQGLARF